MAVCYCHSMCNLSNTSISLRTNTNQWGYSIENVPYIEKYEVRPQGGRVGLIKVLMVGRVICKSFEGYCYQYASDSYELQGNHCS